MNKREKLIITSLTLLLFFVCSFLYLHSINGTVALDQFHERSYFLQDRWWIHFFLSVTIQLIFFMIYKSRLLSKAIYSSMMHKRLLVGSTIVFFILSTLYIWIQQFYPVDDPSAVYDAAGALLAHDYSAWEPGLYMDAYPHLNGLALFYIVFRVLFGEKAYVWIQQFNLCCYVLAGYYLYKLVHKLFSNDILADMSYILFLLYLPFSSYITLVYGIVPGFAAAMFATYFFITYISSKRLTYLLYSGIGITVAYFFKSNYAVFAVAFICILMADLLCHSKLKQFVLATVMFAIMISSVQFFTNKTMEHVVGHTLSKGIPYTGYIAMGMINSGRAPGWYSDYNFINYWESGNDTAVASERAKDDIISHIQDFAAHPGYFMEFYSKKISSQWNNPSFQSFWIQQEMTWYQTDEPDIVDTLIQDGCTLNSILMELDNVAHSFLLLGVLWYLLLYKPKNYYQLLPAIFFLGGFCFHILWEAKSQYAIYYFVLLIPYCVAGYYTFCEKMEQLIINKSVDGNKRLLVGVFCIISLFSLSVLPDSLFMQKTLKYYDDDSTYCEYVQNRTGIYREWQNEIHMQEMQTNEADK